MAVSEVGRAVLQGWREEASKKIKGRKRRAVVDINGRPLKVEPHPADIQDRDAGGALLRASRPIFPFVAGLRRWRLRLRPYDRRDLRNRRDRPQE